MIGLFSMTIHSLAHLSQSSALVPKLWNRDFRLGVGRKSTHPPGFLVPEAVRL